MNFMNEIIRLKDTRIHKHKIQIAPTGVPGGTKFKLRFTFHVLYFTFYIFFPASPE